MSLNIIIYILLTALVIQLLEIAYLIFIYQKKSRELQNMNENASKETSKILTNANKKAEEIIQNAVDKSEDIVYSAEGFKQKLEKEISFVLKDVTEKRKNDVDTMLNTMFTHMKKTFGEMVNSYQETSDTTIQDMKTFVSAELETLKVHGQKKEQIMNTFFENKMNEEFDQMKQELETYKQKRMEEFEDSIRQKVNDITKQVLKISIPVESQEKVLLETLQKAKADNVL